MNPAPIVQRLGSDAVDLSVEFAGIRMQNPVLSASGTFGYAQEFEPYLDLNRLGALVVKTITRRPRPGNPAPRIVETPAGMLNAIGLQNVGIDAFIREKLPYLRKLTPPLLVNVAGESVEDFRELAKRISDQEGVAGIELNVSCPNVAGGLDFSTDPKLTHQVVKAAREATHLPIIPKLSPNVTDIATIARAAEDGGAMASHSSTRWSAWRSTSGRVGPRSPTSRAGSQDRPSARWPSAWSGRWRRPSAFRSLG